MTDRSIFCILCLLGLAFQVPPAGRRNLPPPLRLHVPFETVWKVTETELETEQEEPLLLKDRAQGRFMTPFREFSSGLLTESHIEKIGERPKLIDAVWKSVQYQYDVGLTLIDDKQTLLTVDVNIRALKREFLGAESWVNIPSNGRLETDLLNLIGRNLFGQSFSLAAPKKGFWEREPGYIQDAEINPQVIGPERKRP